jgi:hypothetical protein
VSVVHADSNWRLNALQEITSIDEMLGVVLGGRGATQKCVAAHSLYCGYLLFDRLENSF